MGEFSLSLSDHALEKRSRAGGAAAVLPGSETVNLDPIQRRMFVIFFKMYALSVGLNLSMDRLFVLQFIIDATDCCQVIGCVVR